MAELIAIAFDSREEAQRARAQFAEMQQQYVVELVDSVVAYKDPKGRVQLDQTVNLAANGAVEGSFLGILVGLILSIPTGGLVVPLVTGLFGAGFGALGGKLSDYGIDDEMMKAVAGQVDAGKATLFLLARKITPDRVLEQLGDFEGEVLRTSLPSSLEADLQRELQPKRRSA